MLYLGLGIVMLVTAFTALYGWNQLLTRGWLAAAGTWLLSLAAFLLPLWYLLQ